MVVPGKILVVDDEPAVRVFVSRMLEGAGYQVLQAGDGLAAYHLIRERYQDLDLLITDIQMPRMDGRELVERCLKEHGNLKILCISGYTDPLAPNGHYFLAKPFTSQALLAMVEKVLGVSRRKDAPMELQMPNEAGLRAKLVAAEAKLEIANEEYQRLMALQQDTGVNNDGLLALRQATEIKFKAMRTYTEALSEYTESLRKKQG